MITRTLKVPIGIRMHGKEDVEPFLLARDEGMTVCEAVDFARPGRKTGRTWSAFGFTWRGRGGRVAPQLDFSRSGKITPSRPQKRRFGTKTLDEGRKRILSPLNMQRIA